MERPDATANPIGRWRVLIVDDHALSCAGMAMMFRTVPEVAEVAVATHPSQAIRIALLFQPDVALLDVTMPAWGGFELARRLSVCRVCCRVLFLDDFVQNNHVRSALAVGASGYWTKHATFDELALAVRRVLDGKTAFCPEVESHLTQTPQGLRFQPNLDGTALADLTPEERDVLIHLIDGLTLSQCAEQTHLSECDVVAHRSRLMRKLDARSVVDLARVAAREGLADWSGRGQAPALDL